MIDEATVQLFFSGCLVLVTLGLVFATLRLKTATDNLAKLQILPFLRVDPIFVLNPDDKESIASVQNVGSGSAVNVKVSARLRDGTLRTVEPSSCPTIDRGIPVDFVIKDTKIGDVVMLTLKYQDMKEKDCDPQTFTSEVSQVPTRGT